MIVDGRALAKEILERTKVRAEHLARTPKVVWYVASEPTVATQSYLKIKERSAEVAGCAFEEVRDVADFANADAAIIQLPVPQGFSLDVLPLEKDADVLSSAAREKFEGGDDGALLPPVVGAVQKILEFGNVEVAGKKAVVLGAGFLVGAPCATWLKQQGADVDVLTIENSEEEIVAALEKADVIICGAGSPHFIKPRMLKKGAVLIDAGTSELGGRVAGDADPACAEVCSLFTPVPGGVGPLAVACLFENAVTLAERA